jgi:hypothetical protein
MKKTVNILMISLIFSVSITQCGQKTHEETPKSGEDITGKEMNDSKGKITKLGDTFYVYPEDLGYVTHVQAEQICDKVNAQKSYGHNDWRLPLQEELLIIHKNQEEITGLVDGYYHSIGTMMNEWGNTVGYHVFNMKSGETKWRPDTGDCEDYMPVDEQANLRLVRGDIK